MICLCGSAFQLTRMRSKERDISPALCFTALFPGPFVRPISSKHYERVFQKSRVRAKLPSILPSAEPGFAFAVDPVRVYFARLSGGHISAQSFSVANAAGPNRKNKGGVIWRIIRGMLGF